jgi:hypothetical protein
MPNVALDSGERLVAVIACNSPFGLQAPTYNGTNMILDQSILNGNIGSYIYSTIGLGSTVGNVHVQPTISGNVGVALLKIQNLPVMGEDATAVNTGSGTDPSTGPMNVTQADSIIIAGIATQGPHTDVDGLWSITVLEPIRDGSDSGTPDNDATIAEGYEILSATGLYTIAKTGNTSRNWAVASMTYY